MGEGISGEGISGKDSRAEAPQATTEHRVANVYLSQQSNLGAMPGFNKL